jgi:hypothetical protein
VITLKQFLSEADYKGKTVSLDAPFPLRDDPEFTKGVYAQGEDGKVKLVRYGKKDEKDKVEPKKNPQTTTPDGKEPPKKTSSQYWNDKEGID